MPVLADMQLDYMNSTCRKDRSLFQSKTMFNSSVHLQPLVLECTLHPTWLKNRTLHMTISSAPAI